MISFYYFSFDKFFMLISYVMSIIFFFNFTSPFIFWIWLELNMILFIGCMVTHKCDLTEVDIFFQSIYYFILQSFFSILLLIFFSMELFKYNSFLVLLVILMKMGIFPFHFWVYKISEYLSSMNLFLLLNFQKIPLLLFIVTYHFDQVLVVLVLNMIFGSLFLLKSKNLIEFLVSSSICFLNWFFLILVWSLLGFFLFFFKYMVFNVILLSLKKFSGHFELGSLFYTKIIFLITFLMGLPPFLYFFFKVYAISILVQLSSLSLILLVWLFSYICMISYFNMFLFFFFKWSKKYNSMETISNMDLLMMLSLLLSMILFS